MKIILNKEEWKFTPKMDVETFLQVNEHHFIDSYVDSNPEKSYLINDGDLEHMYEWYLFENRDIIIEYMVECFQQYLSILSEKVKKENNILS